MMNFFQAATKTIANGVSTAMNNANRNLSGLAALAMRNPQLTLILMTVVLPRVISAAEWYTQADIDKMPTNSPLERERKTLTQQSFDKLGEDAFNWCLEFIERNAECMAMNTLGGGNIADCNVDARELEKHGLTVEQCQRDIPYQAWYG